MSRILLDFIESLRVVGSLSHENMTVFGVSVGSRDGVEYVTLDEALAKGMIEILEKDEGGSVPEVVVKNAGDTRVLMISGEELVGAKQNRVLNTSVLVARRSETVIPVSCVEQGRWSYRSRCFDSGSTSHSRMRAMLSKQVSDSLRENGTHNSDQHAIWGEVFRMSATLGSSSPSSALRQVFEDHEERLRHLVARFRELKGVHGIIVAVNGKVVGMDVFDKPSTMARLLPKLIQSYGLVAIELCNRDGSRADISSVGEFLEKILKAKAERQKSVCLGEEIRVVSEHVVGHILLHEGHVLHGAMFCSPN